MSAGHRCRTEAALRTAVEEHLRQRAHDTGVPLDRLRREVAHQRLLARLMVVAPTGSWALFERIQLDINAVPDDQRPLECLELRDLLDFAGIAPPSIPVIPVAQHLAEKLHAYVRDDASRSNSRPRDLYDMLVIARSLPIPDSDTLLSTCRETFALRQTNWPPAMPAPATTWIAAWESYVRDHGIPWTLDAPPPGW